MQNNDKTLGINPKRMTEIMKTLKIAATAAFTAVFFIASQTAQAQDAAQNQTGKDVIAMGTLPAKPVVQENPYKKLHNFEQRHDDLVARIKSSTKISRGSKQKGLMLSSIGSYSPSAYSSYTQLKSACEGFSVDAANEANATANNPAIAERDKQIVSRSLMQMSANLKKQLGNARNKMRVDR